MTAARTLAFLVAMVVMAAGPAHAERKTVCTVTVNSADEREAFREFLPKDKYDFVELVERGRQDWLASSCRKGVKCDVLVVSGHFAGTEFYSSKPQNNETLPIDEVERVACSDSCPDLFSQLKEVYLFGCDTLKPEPVFSASPEIVRGLMRAGQPRADAERFARALSERNAENARDRMRRVFPNVPVIYGFSSLAPYGRVAGPMLKGYFRSGANAQIGSGRVSSRLVKLFAPSSMVVTNGLRESDPDADQRAQSCRLYDDRVTRADKLRIVHRSLAGDMPQARIAFDHAERFFAGMGAAERQDPAIAGALAEMAVDRTARHRYVALTRETEDPALRARMIALARTVGWLTAQERQAELGHLIKDVLASDAVGFSEVEMICALNKERELDPALHRVRDARPSAKKPAHAAAMACLGSEDGRARVLRALASTDESDVQVAQAYLRHRPITDPTELHRLALDIAKMKGSGAQVRALETLARHHVSDHETLGELSRLFATTSYPAVQRAVAEIFIRSDLRTIAVPQLVEVLRQHRLKAPGDGQDLVDVLLGRLTAS